MRELSDAEAQKKLDKLVKRHGPFQAHNIRLSENVYSISASSHQGFGRHGRFLALATSLYGMDLTGLRVLDLGCFEGITTIEFAKRGATVLGIEARESNLAKARGIAGILGLDNAAFDVGDVRDLSKSRHGTFDIVICSGVLYHLDQPEVFHFIKNMADCSTRLVVIDTATARRGAMRVAFEGQTYHGKSVVEHHPDDDESVKKERRWASIDNVRSFYFTRASLINIMTASGLSSVSELKMPFKYKDGFHRTTFFGFKSESGMALTEATPFPEEAYVQRVGTRATRKAPNAVQDAG